MSALKSIPQYPGVPHTVFMSTWCSTILESPKSARKTREELSVPRHFAAFISTSAFQKQNYVFVYFGSDGGWMWVETSHFSETKK